MKRIIIVVGTRPNFIKITQFKKIAVQSGLMEVLIVHTGQHYEKQLSDVFFNQFNLFPDFFLNVNPASSNSQMAEIMLGLERLINEHRPDMIMVPGDVNSTLAAAITANKCHVRLAHIESGLRSFDRTMPEEFNRITTDVLSDYLFVTEQSGLDNLSREGRKKEDIFFVGNTMIDTLVAYDRMIQASNILPELKIKKRKFLLMTMHRPSNVDLAEGLEKLLYLLQVICRKYPVVFPVHPRTIKNMEKLNMESRFRNIANLIPTPPLDYFSFQKLVAETLCVITDSGGVQEESTFRGVPCLTLRPNTERPVTVNLGTNEILPFDTEMVKERLIQIEEGKGKKGVVPPLWEGYATERIMKILPTLLS